MTADEDGARSATATRRRSLLRLAIAVGLALWTAAVFAPALAFDFVSLDDPAHILGNERVLAGLEASSLRWALTTGHAANWQPLTWIAHMAAVEAFGRDPAGHHALSVALHVASTVLVFVVLVAMTGRSARSAVVAALFGLHPTHVESVVWASELKDVLSGLWALLTLAAYLAYARVGGGRRALRYGLVVGFYALGLASKPMLVTLPFVLLLFDLWPLGRLRLCDPVPGRERSRMARAGRALLVRCVGAERPGRFRVASGRALLVEKVPLLALSLAASVLTLRVQHGGGAMAVAGGLGPGARLANAAVSVLRYLERLLWPVDLGPLVPHPLLAEEGGHGLAVSDVGLAVLVLALGCVVAVRAGRAVAIGWALFLGMLVPVIGIVQVGPQGLADRYLYLPSLGVFVALVWGLGDRLARAPRALRRAATAAGVVLALAATLATSLQLRVWRDSLALYRHVLTIDASNLGAHYAIAAVYRGEGRWHLAEAHYREVLRYRPRSARAHNGLGAVLMRTGRTREAAAHFEQALAERPRLHLALQNLGAARRALGDAEGAEPLLRAALDVHPDAIQARLELADLLREQGRRREARRAYEQVLARRPDSARARRGLKALGH